MKKIAPLLILAFFTLSGFSQKWKLTRYEALVGVGFANYFGDIGGAATQSNWYGIKDIDILGTRPTITFGARYKIVENMAIKLNINALMLGGRDKGSVNNSRGYSFNSFGTEHGLQYEYYFMSEDRRRTSFARFNKRGMLNNYSKISLYGFAGLGGCYVVVSNNVVATTYDYKKTSAYTPVVFAGIGLKTILNNQYAFGFEFGPRFTRSDYLDGFSSQFSESNDVYYFGSFNLIYRIKTSRKGYPILFRRYE